MTSITEKIAQLEAAAKEADNYTNMPMEVDPRYILELISRIRILQEHMDALARENKAMRRCAIKYLEWLGVTHISLDHALYEDMCNPDMCGEAALARGDER